MTTPTEPNAPAPRRRPRWRTALEWALVLAFVVAIRAYQTRDAASGVAPAVVLEDVRGGDVALTSLRGAPSVVHFWATWCGVCKAMAHNVDAIGDDPRVVTIVSRSGSLDDVRGYLRAHPTRARVLFDSGEAARRFGVRAFPTTFYLDRGGVIRHVETGYTTELGMRLRLFGAGLRGG